MTDVLFAQDRPKILTAMPDLEMALLDRELISRFPHIVEFGHVSFQDIMLRSLDMHHNNGIEICYIHKGRYNWLIEDKNYILYPGDCFITYPWQKHGSPDGFVDIGTISWIIIKPSDFQPGKKFRLGNWSRLSAVNQDLIAGHFLKTGKQHFPNKAIGKIFERLQMELSECRLAYDEMVNHLLDELIIQVSRSMLSEECRSQGRKGHCIQDLELKLRNELSHKWSLKEMAEIMGIGQTSLNLLLRKEIGLSPGQYLMHLRISAARDMLFKSGHSISEIAFDCGFSSSQHFSNAFRKKTGYSPSEFSRLEGKSDQGIVG
jgi:AraC-like DNA-binding protein